LKIPGFSWQFGIHVLAELYPTVGDLRRASDMELLRAPNVGNVRLAEIRKVVGRQNGPRKTAKLRRIYNGYDALSVDANDVIQNAKFAWNESLHLEKKSDNK
jgi:hypothetical protein